MARVHERKLQNRPGGRNKSQEQLERERLLNPVLIDPGGSSTNIKVIGNKVVYSAIEVNADYTATGNEDIILVDATYGAVTVTLPATSGVLDNRIEVKKVDKTRNKVAVVSANSDDVFEEDEKEVSVNVQNDSLSFVKVSASKRIII